MISPKSIFALTPTVDKNRTKQDAKKKKSNDIDYIIDSDVKFLKQNSELNNPDKIMSLTKDIKFYLLKLGLPANLFTRVPISSFNYFFSWPQNTGSALFSIRNGSRIGNTQNCGKW